MRAVDGERVGLHERARVHQDVEPLAGGQLALVVLLLRGVAPAGRERGLAALAELLDPILDGAVGRGGLPSRSSPWAESSDEPPAEALSSLRRGQPACLQPPAACTIRTVTIAFVRP